MKIIKESTDWSEIETELTRKSMNYMRGNDVRRMIKNIGTEITQLSKAEVTARQGKKLLAKELLVKINQDIELVEEFLLVAALIG